MFSEIQPPQASAAARLKLWGGMVLAVGLMLLLVKLMMWLAWFFGSVVALVGLVMLLIGIIWDDVAKKRKP